MRNFLICSLLLSFIGLSAFQPDNKIPSANAEIIKYVQTVIGKKVDRGECWDLANQALTRINAVWDHEFKYGKLLDPSKDAIYPGDIIQFKKVKVVYKVDELTTTTETMAQHTAIVYQVLAKGEFILAHQNTGFSGRKVGTSRFNLSNVKRGKVMIYRPVVKE